MCANSSTNRTSSATATRSTRRLVLTRYIDRTIEAVQAELPAAVSAGLNDAQVAAATESTVTGLRLVGD